MVHRISSDVPSSIMLDHGDLLVMHGPAQSECAHRTVPGLQGPRVNRTYRWVTQHITSCPLAGVVGCVLPSGVQCLTGPSVGESNWALFWWMILLLSIGLCFFWGMPGLIVGGSNATVVIAQPAWRRVPLGVPLAGLGEAVGDCRCAVITHSGVIFGSPWVLFGEERREREGVLRCFELLNILVTKEGPTSGHHGVCSVWLRLMGHLGRNTGRSTVRPHFPP